MRSLLISVFLIFSACSSIDKLQNQLNDANEVISKIKERLPIWERVLIRLVERYVTDPVLRDELLDLLDGEGQ